jgi:hypothetical protein
VTAERDRADMLATAGDFAQALPFYRALVAATPDDAALRLAFGGAAISVDRVAAEAPMASVYRSMLARSCCGSRFSNSVPQRDRLYRTPG